MLALALVRSSWVTQARAVLALCLCFPATHAHYFWHCSRAHAVAAPLLGTQQQAEYRSDAADLVRELRASVAFDAAGGASEREVRRRADPAKAAVERFIRKWRGQAAVLDQPSYGALVGASHAHLLRVLRPL